MNSGSSESNSKSSTDPSTDPSTKSSPPPSSWITAAPLLSESRPQPQEPAIRYFVDKRSVGASSSKVPCNDQQRAQDATGDRTDALEPPISSTPPSTHRQLIVDSPSTPPLPSLAPSLLDSIHFVAIIIFIASVVVFIATILQSKISSAPNSTLKSAPDSAPIPPLQFHPKTTTPLASPADEKKRAFLHSEIEAETDRYLKRVTPLIRQLKELENPTKIEESNEKSSTPKKWINVLIPSDLDHYGDADTIISSRSLILSAKNHN